MPGTLFMRSLAIQGRVVHALLMREVLTRYGRHNLGFLWLFLEPMLFTLVITALWSALRADRVTSLPIVAFVVTGYSSVLFWRSMPARCLSAIEPNRALMHHRNVRLIDLYLARLILEVVGVSASLIILTLLFWSLGMMSLPEDVLTVVGACLLLAWFGAAFAIGLACLALRSELVEKFWHPLAFLMLPLSGAPYMVDWLPPAAREFVLLLPMVHCTEMIREGYIGSHVRTWYDPSYVIVVSMALTFVGLALLRDSVHWLNPE